MRDKNFYLIIYTLLQLYIIPIINSRNIYEPPETIMEFVSYY